MTMIEVYADIWCPFTHVGLKRLVAKREEVGATTLLQVRAWPLELVNGAPMDPAFIAEEVEELRDQVAGDLFVGFDETTFPTTTLPALALADAAYELGAGQGEAMSLLLRHALFEEGRDISDPAVLAELGATLGLPPSGEVEVAGIVASWEAGKARGVIGSPHFFIPAGGFFCPALDIKRVEGHLRIKSDLEAFESFVASCFAD